MVDIYSQRWYAKHKEQKKMALAKRKEETPLAMAIYRANHRGRGKGLEANLKVGDLVSPEVCPVLGIPVAHQKGQVGPNSPAIDRINNTKGYTKDNCRVISNRANNLKSDATAQELLLVAEDAMQFVPLLDLIEMAKV